MAFKLTKTVLAVAMAATAAAAISQVLVAPGPN